MSCERLRELLLEDAALVLACQPSGRPGAWLLSTPLLYSDQDVVQVLIEERDDEVVVSDAALTLMRLDLGGAAVTGRAHRSRIVTIARSFGLWFDEGSLLARVPLSEAVGAVWRVASAAVQVDGLIHEDFSGHSETFSSQVERWLREHTADRVVVPNATLPETDRSVTAKIDNGRSLYLQAVSGAAPIDRRRSVVTAAFDFEAATTLVPAQRIVVARGRLQEFRRDDLERLAANVTIGSWEYRNYLAEHLAAADSDTFTERPRVLLPQAMNV